MKKLRVKIRGSFSIQPKVPENFGWYIVHQMEWTISVWSERNIRDQL